MKKLFIKKIRKTKNKSNESGVTLVELMLYMGILAIVLIILTELLVASMDVRLESAATSSVNQDGKFITARLLYDISRADSVTLPL